MGCKYCPLLLCRGMFGIDLTESAPFTCLLIFFLLFFFFFFFFCCFAFIAWRLPFFATPSLFQTRLRLCRELSGSKSHAAQWQSGALSCSKGATQSLTPPPGVVSLWKIFIFFLLLNFRFLCVIIGLGAYCLCVKDRVGLAMRGRWKKV